MLWILLLGWMGSLPGLQAQEARRPVLEKRAEVVSVERSGHQYRVTVQVATEEKEGTILSVRLTPKIRRYGPDRRAFVETPTQIGAVSTRAEVRKGAFSFTVDVPFLRGYDVRFSLPSGAGEQVPVLLHDPALTAVDLPEQIREFDRQYGRAEDLLGELQSYQGSDKPLPAKMGRKLAELQTALHAYAESGTLLNVSATMMYELLVMIASKIPWTGEQTEDALPEGLAGYGASPKRDPAEFNVTEWKACLARTREMALREAMLSILDPLSALLEQTVAEGETKGRTDSVRSYGRLYRILRTGRFGEAYAAYPPATEVADFLSSLDERMKPVAPSTPDGAREPRADGWKEMSERLRGLRGKILSGETQS